MECATLSDMAALRVAIEVCHNPKLKREILCAPVSGFMRNYRVSVNHRLTKEKWDKIVEEKATLLLKELWLGPSLTEKVMGNVLSVGMNMLTWAEYHEGTLGISRLSSLNFLNKSLLTPQGIIDNKKAASVLIKETHLSLAQEYKLACIYCFTESIGDIYKEMTIWQRKYFYDPYCYCPPLKSGVPELEAFWTCYLMGKISELKKQKTLSQYRLAIAVINGSKAAVEYCLAKGDLSDTDIIAAALQAMRRKERTDQHAINVLFDLETDWIMFRKQIYNSNEEFWTPSEYYLDIAYFLLTKMSKDQQIKLLKKDLEDEKNQSRFPENDIRSRVLESFLNWPYQNYFLKMAKLMWEFIPEKHFAVLLLKICDKIESKPGNLKYGEEKNFDYRNLLKEFWCQSPERCKRFVLRDGGVFYATENAVFHKVTIGILKRLYFLKNFTSEDRSNIDLIFSSALREEKEYIISSDKGKEVCILLMQAKKWEILNDFVMRCFSSREQAHKFKKELSSTKEAQSVCINFIKKSSWNAATSFLVWSSSTEKAEELKKEYIHSDVGTHLCIDLLLYEDVDIFNNFCKWCFPAEEDIIKFKKELISLDFVLETCELLALTGKFELVNNLTACCCSDREFKAFKENIAYTRGNRICEILISDSSSENIETPRRRIIARTIVFKGGKWEEVEKFLTGCFSSEEEIDNFKRSSLLKMNGKQIHFNLIQASQFETAKTFFSWLGLSLEETNQLKKDTLFHHDAAIRMFKKLMYKKKSNKKKVNNNKVTEKKVNQVNKEKVNKEKVDKEKVNKEKVDNEKVNKQKVKAKIEVFVDYGTKKEAIELVLGWYLPDRESAFEFKDEFRRWYCGDMTKTRKAMFLRLDMAIARRILDLKGQRGTKRKYDLNERPYVELKRGSRKKVKRN